MQTEVQRPAKTMRPLPMRLTSLMTFSSSQVFIDVRSMAAWPGKAALISSNMGPEKLFSATVVRMVGTLKPAAAWATRPALLRSTTGSMDLVAKAIWDWWSMRMRAWSLGVSKDWAGLAWAVGMAISRIWSKI